MKKLAGLIIGAVALLVVSAAPARAQMWVSGMFSVQEWNSNWDGSKGFAADFGGVIHKTSKTAGALYADFSYNTFTDFDENDTAFVGGFREIFMINKYFNPYVHASTGVMHWSDTFFETSGNDWLIGGGGGVMVNLNKSWGVKVQYDFWKPWETFNGNSDWNGTIQRWTFGGTFMWGGQ